MKIKNYPTPETCQKLKDLGFSKETEHVYFQYQLERDRTGDNIYWKIQFSDVRSNDLKAPTFNEIWEELPSDIEIILIDENKSNNKVNVSKNLNDFHIYYEGKYFNSDFKECYHTCFELFDTNITEGAAQMWILLKEMKYI